MNPALQRLGFGEQDRVLIIHADDIGMCQATLPALADALDFGLVSSAAVMTPCAWFPAAAEFCRAHPEIDMGVHLTLNSEWDAYRWGPISTRDPATGLLDAQGYFHQWPPETFAQAAPAAVEVEIRAQVERALGAGIRPTHVDSHMGTVAWPPFTAAYIQVAQEYRLPLFFLGGAAALRRAGLSEEAVAMAAPLTQDLLERGVPLFDAFESLPLDDPTDHVGAARRIIEGLQPGLTMLVLHPAADTPELRAIAPDWPCRVANLAAVLSPELRDYVRQSGAQVIGYRPLRDLLRGV
jgi:chitin disaccharide deacetylase